MQFRRRRRSSGRERGVDGRDLESASEGEDGWALRGVKTGEGTGGEGWLLDVTHNMIFK